MPLKLQVLLIRALCYYFPTNFIALENLFNIYQKNLFTLCGTTFGCFSIWHCSDGSTQNAIVLFGEPSRKVQLNDVDYLPPSYHIEYMKGTFVNLQNNVNSGMQEIVELSGDRYSVLQVYSKFDGKTLIAVLTPSL